MSKFKDILKAAGKTSEETQGDTPDSTPDSTPSPKTNLSDRTQTEASPEASQKNHRNRNRNRPSGDGTEAKRSDPNFTQISAYIKKDTHRKVKMKLLEIESEQDLSELIEELLQEWLKQPD